MDYGLCYAMASSAYNVPQNQLAAIVESRPTSGVGPMGIPAEWLTILERAGFSIAALTNSPCENIAAGAWIMAFESMTARGDANHQSDQLRRSPLPSPVRISQDKSEIDRCAANAAKIYDLPVSLLKGILATENGHVGQIHWNNNGSYDMGPAQINSRWLPTLQSEGIDRSEVIDNPCLNVSIGAWILAQDMQGADLSNPSQFWQHVGDYNSRTPIWNERYARLVWQNIMAGDP